MKLLMKNQIQVVFFDASGTLFEVRGSVGEVYSQFARQYGIDADPTSIHQSFLLAFRKQPPLAFPPETPKLLLHQLEFAWWSRLAREVFAEYDFPLFDQFFADLFEYFRGSNPWYVFDDVMPTLEALKDRGLRLAVISNFDSRLYDLLCNLRLERFFDAVHVSAHVGVEKPDPIIFHTALNAHAVEAQQAYHVGDRLETDVEGAAAVGINVALIDRKAKIQHPARIERLDQLLGLIM